MINEALIISLFCVGLRITTEKNMILDFIRSPYEKLLSIDDDNMTMFAWASYYVLTPIIGCITCMSSFWTLVISYFYFEISYNTILNIFIVSALNTILYSLRVKLL